MIVKQRSFRLSSGTLYGFAGGVFGVVTLGLMVQSHLAPETYPSCGERYTKAGMFGVQRTSGTLLSAPQLQSRMAGQEWGVLQNLSIEKNDAIPHKAAMAVKFNAGGTADFEKRQSASGMGFTWRPAYLKKSSSACLSYALRLPKKFTFGKGGTLPGLIGSATAPGGKADFSLRMRWLGGGKLGIQPVTPAQRDGSLLVLNDQWLKLPREKWVEIEQEVVLNTPGKRDGVLRIWVDGKLQLNMPGLAFRKSAKTGFAGVIADTHYSDGVMDWAPAPRSTEIKMSPMVVRWNPA